MRYVREALLYIHFVCPRIINHILMKLIMQLCKRCERHTRLSPRAVGPPRTVNRSHVPPFELNTVWVGGSDLVLLLKCIVVSWVMGNE